MSAKMNIQIEFTKGLPPHGGPFVFLMWDGSLCEGILHTEGEQRILTTFNLSGPSPEMIAMRADTGKVQAYAELRGHPSVK